MTTFPIEDTEVYSDDNFTLAFDQPDEGERGIHAISNTCSRICIAIARRATVRVLTCIHCAT